jgi:hypothetical protein
MSLLDDASLLVTPNAEKEGKLYSIIPTNGNGDFSVTRATTATRVNAAGLVELVPYNLLQYSEQFDNAIWGKTAGIVVTPNALISPSGVLNADYIQFGASNRAISQATSLGIGIVSTGSIYVKGVAGETIALAVGGIDTLFTLNGNWQRLESTKTSVNAFLNINTFAGATARNIYIWGAQLVEGASALDYQMTETRLNIPRLDYSLGSCPNILLEPQRTNLALRSEEFNDATWVKNAASVTANATTSPSGIANADTLTGDGSSAVHSIQQNASFTLNAAYSISFYVKKSTNNFAQIYTFNGTGGQFANFDINSGVVGTLGTTFGTAPTSSITSVGNGWYRCTMIFTAALTASSGFGIALVSSSTSARLEANTLTTSVFLWGAQLEAGAYQTSYIPTSSASVTRNADVISRGNIFTNGLITASGGTWFVDIRNNRVLARDNSNRFGIADTSALSNDALTISTGSSAGRLQIQKRVAGTLTALYATTTDTCKIAIKWNGATADVFENGVKVVSATPFTPTNMEFLATNTAGVQVPFNINSMGLFPTAKTDAQLIALTTL